MAHGGSRPGSGRKAGAATKLNEAARKKATASGITPLDYMLRVLRDEREPPAIRMDAAKAAAPYVHAKLASVEHKGEVTKTYVVRMPAPVESLNEWQQRYAPTSKQPKSIQ